MKKIFVLLISLSLLLFFFLVVKVYKSPHRIVIQQNHKDYNLFIKNLKSAFIAKNIIINGDRYQIRIGKETLKFNGKIKKEQLFTILFKNIEVYQSCFNLYKNIELIGKIKIKIFLKKHKNGFRVLKDTFHFHHKNIENCIYETSKKILNKNKAQINSIEFDFLILPRKNIKTNINVF